MDVKNCAVSVKRHAIERSGVSQVANLLLNAHCLPRRASCTTVVELELRYIYVRRGANREKTNFFASFHREHVNARTQYK